MTVKSLQEKVKELEKKQSGLVGNLATLKSQRENAAKMAQARDQKFVQDIFAVHNELRTVEGEVRLAKEFLEEMEKTKKK